MKKSSVPFLFLLFWSFTVLGQDHPSYSEAELVVSTEPIKAVLTVTTLSMDMTRRSAILYGDGRLELEDNRLGRWQRTLAPDEIEALIRLGVDRGLAEWDGDTIRAQQLRKLGRPFPGVTDGVEVRILLVLESYSRGSYQPGPVSRSIGVRSPSIVANYFPEIPQFEGAALLASWLDEEIAKARESDR